MSHRRIAAVFNVVLTCALAGMPSAGQENGSLQSREWKTSDEVTLSGVIRERIEKRPEGAPGGVNLLMSGSQSSLPVNLGSKLDANTAKLLVSGEPITVVGLVRTIRGQSYLLAREVTLGGRKIEVRSANGFPVRAAVRATPQPRLTQNNSNGGAR